MKIKNNQKSYVDIKIKYGPCFEYELPDTFEEFKNDFLKKGYNLSKGELSIINSDEQKIIIKSRNDYISLLRSVHESKTKLELFYRKQIMDSFICDMDFINIQNVYSDLNTDESILDLSQSINNNELNIIEEDDDEKYYINGINIILNIFKKKIFFEIIIKIKGKDFYERKYGLKKFERIPKNILSSSININYKIPSIENLIKTSKISIINNEDNILNNLYDQFEKMEEIRNNNTIYQTMINKNSKFSIIKKEESNIFTDKKNKINETQITHSSFFYECNHCHINHIINKRYKCSKCINYNLCEECEEKNSEIFFHPHSEFILIRINKNNISENPYSYQCLTKNLVFNINKKDINDDKIIIKNILLKNNFILPWPGYNNTLIKCDKSLSTIFCDKIYLPNLLLGNSINIDFIFQKANKIPKGEYKCICNFFVNNIIYGEPLELNINII